MDKVHTLLELTWELKPGHLQQKCWTTRSQIILRACCLSIRGYKHLCNIYR